TVQDSGDNMNGFDMQNHLGSTETPAEVDTNEGIEGQPVVDENNNTNLRREVEIRPTVANLDIDHTANMGINVIPAQSEAENIG
ncbi:hypothetical protein FRX31_008478, partial [Thalictrum thalictroides]